MNEPQPHEAGEPLEVVRPGPTAMFPVKVEGHAGIVVTEEGEPEPFVRLTLACARVWNDEEASDEVELWLPAAYALAVQNVLARQIAVGAARAAEYRARGN